MNIAQATDFHILSRYSQNKLSKENVNEIINYINFFALINYENIITLLRIRNRNLHEQKEEDFE